MNKVLIFGASGLIGKALIEEYKDVFDLYGTYSSSPTNLYREQQFQLNITEIDKLREILRTINPDIVISCLRGDFKQQLEFHKQLGIELKNSEGILYYFSTANVFDADVSKLYFETDTPFAKSDYGRFKIECENMLKQMLDERAIIIRIPAIWGKDSLRMNQVRQGIENNNQFIDVYSNVECNNLLDTQLAKQLMFIIENNLKGIFHLGSIDMLKQAEFYERLMDGISGNKDILRFKKYDETDKIFYFGLKSMRNDIPDYLQSTNQNVISGLI